MSRRYCPIVQIVSLFSVLALLPVLSGCATGDGPSYLTVPGESYDAAFDAAVEAAREYGLIASLRDPRAGIIETGPGRAPSILEPWDRSNRTLALAVENTLALQRRRARFEFTPLAFRDRPDGEATLTGPDILARTSDPVDLTDFSGELELRVWVYLERSHVPGLRRSAWTRRKTSRTLIVEPEPRGRERSETSWTPIARDPALERELLAAVWAMMQQQVAPQDAAAP